MTKKSTYRKIIESINTGHSREEIAVRLGLHIRTVGNWLNPKKNFAPQCIGPAKPIYEKKTFIKCRHCGKNAWPNRFFCHYCHEVFRISGKHAIAEKHAASIQKKTPEIPDPTWPEEIAELPAEYWTEQC